MSLQRRATLRTAVCIICGPKYAERDQNAYSFECLREYLPCPRAAIIILELKPPADRQHHSSTTTMNGIQDRNGIVKRDCETGLL